jgi:glycosyltransferase involved in cell wall biosynthesis
VPHIITAHSVIYREPNALSPARRWLAKWAIRSAAAVLPVSDRLGRDMQQVNGLSGNYITVPNVVDEQLFTLSDGWKEGKVFKLLHVSNFDQWQKNPEGLLRAFAALNAEQPGCFSLRIAGDGDPNFLRSLIEKSGLSMEVVTLTGPHSEWEIADLMQQHHALVLFSNYETQGVVLLEALISGLPCVATGVGGINDVITSGENGYLVTAGDEDALTAALLKVKRNYFSFDRERIAQRAVARYGEEAVLHVLDNIYRSSVEGTLTT